MILVMNRFQGCWKRIERAEAHGNAFAKICNSIVDDPNSYHAIVRVNDDGTGTIQIAPRHSDVLMSNASLELGEMLYQLRAALDGSVYECAVSKSGKTPPPEENKLEFPVCSSPRNFHNAARKIAPLSQKQRDIIQSVQPYNVGPSALDHKGWSIRRSLGILSDWARIDRHRRLHFVGTWASQAEPILHLPDGGSIVHFTPTASGLLEHESQRAVFRLTGWIPGMRVEAKPNILIKIEIDEAPPLRDETDTLLERLKAMRMATRVVVQLLEESF